MRGEGELKILEKKIPMFRKKYTMVDDEGTVVPYTGTPGRSQFGPSQTVPDMSLSLREVMHRYTRNQPIMGGSGFYDDENPSMDAVDFHRLDLAEQEDYLLSKQNELRDLKSRINESKKSKKTTAKDDEAAPKKNEEDGKGEEKL